VTEVNAALAASFNFVDRSAPGLCVEPEHATSVDQTPAR
jgi:hypothetical protein